MFMRHLPLVLLLLPAPAAAQSYPAYQSVYVNDFADLIEPDAEARITAMLRAVRRERGVEMTVVTIGSRRDYGDSAGIEEFATGLFNAWGVGDARRNDGIMVLVAWRDQDMRIELGEGYPPVFDDRVKRVIDHHFIPWFRQGEYSRGIEAGVAETIKRTRLEFTDQGHTLSSRLAAEGANAVESAASGGLFAWIFGALGLGGAGGGALLFRRHLRNRPRRCDICGRRMERLSETGDDSHLDRGQIVEERLKSRDYDVWLCRHDDRAMIEGYRNWFTSYAACPDCGYRTLHSQRTVLEAATTSHSGRARIDYDCRNCDHRHSELVTIAQKSENGSSSSSGGSFGGGSSSGGGASGSW